MQTPSQLHNNCKAIILKEIGGNSRLFSLYGLKLGVYGLIIQTEAKCRKRQTSAL